MKIDTGEAVGLFKFIVNKMSWKLAAQFIVIGSFCGISYFAWEARWKIYTETANRWARPEIIKDRLPRVIDELAIETRAKTIIIWAANVAGDTKRPIYVWVNGQRHPELEGRTEPLFPDSVDGTLQVARLIRGDEFCGDHHHMERDRPILRDAGVVWGCAISIPPEYGAIIGAITVGFTSDRSADYRTIRSSLDRWSKYSTGRDLK